MKNSPAHMMISGKGKTVSISRSAKPKIVQNFSYYFNLHLRKRKRILTLLFLSSGSQWQKQFAISTPAPKLTRWTK